MQLSEELFRDLYQVTHLAEPAELKRISSIYSFKWLHHISMMMTWLEVLVQKTERIEHVTGSRSCIGFEAFLA
jgi:hypothetical protein